LVVICIIAALVYSNYKPEHPTQTVIASDVKILFYGKECPHCIELEKYITDNNIHAKIDFIEKEVFHDHQNLDLFVKKANICNIKLDAIGVPFFWDGVKCLEGEDKILNYFKKVESEK
jgi:glutaredoxin-related protein